MPVGKTCAFCCMLASRGFVYTSSGTAGSSRHANCDCQVVPGWGPKAREAVIAGYNPDTYYDMYRKAEAKLARISRAEAAGRQLDDEVSVSLRDTMGRWWKSLADKGNSGMRPPGYRRTLGSYLKGHDGYENADSSVRQRALLGLMRRMNPDDLSDGVHTGERAVPDNSMKLRDWEDYRSSLASRYIAASNRSWGFPPKKPAPVPEDWPDDVPKPSVASWNHILYGYGERADGEWHYHGGHLHGYGWIEDEEYHNTTFPADWTPEDVEEAVTTVLRSGTRGSQMLYSGEYRNVRVLVLVSPKGEIVSAYPGR